LNVVSLLRSKIKTIFKPDLNKLKIIKNTKKRGVKRFIASSPNFLKSHSKEIITAGNIISANLSKLLMGKSIEKKGFVIKSVSTGNYAGQKSTLSFCVFSNKKTFFVKMGAHTGESAFLGYKRAKSLLEKKNTFNGYKAEVVPSHFFYKKTNLKSAESKGFLVSDFFPSEKVSLALDLSNGGLARFSVSPVGKAISEASDYLFLKGIDEATLHNCFVDKVEKKIYFFDLSVNSSFH